MSGRRVEWALVALSGLISLAVLPLSAPTAGPGDPLEFEVGITASDAVELECAGTFDAARCALDSRHAPSGAARPLRPFMTSWRELVLISGLFEDPEVQQWVQHHAPTDQARIRCTGTVISRSADVEFHFRRRDAWGRRTMAVLDAHRCRVQ